MKKLGLFLLLLLFTAPVHPKSKKNALKLSDYPSRFRVRFAHIVGSTCYMTLDSGYTEYDVQG